MSSNIYKHVRLGLIHFKAFPGIEFGEGPILESLERICADDFWTAVEVCWMKDYCVRNTARHLLRHSHLSVAFATQPRMLSQKLSLNALDPKERKAAIDAVKNSIDEAYDVGAEVVRLMAGKDPGQEKREEAKKLLIESLHEVLEYGKQEGTMQFTLKLFDRDIDKKNLIGPAHDAKDIAEAISPHHANFGLLTDLSHFPLLRERPAETIPLLQPWLRSFHVGNCVVSDRSHPAYGDVQPRFGVEGGSIDLPEVVDYFKVLDRYGFFAGPERPIISAEVRPVLFGEKSEIIIANAKRVIRDAWALADIGNNATYEGL